MVIKIILEMYMLYTLTQLVRLVRLSVKNHSFSDEKRQNDGVRRVSQETDGSAAGKLAAAHPAHFTSTYLKVPTSSNHWKDSLAKSQRGQLTRSIRYAPALHANFLLFHPNAPMSSLLEQVH